MILSSAVVAGLAVVGGLIVGMVIGAITLWRCFAGSQSKRRAASQDAEDLCQIRERGLIERWKNAPDTPRSGRKYFNSNEIQQQKEVQLILRKALSARARCVGAPGPMHRRFSSLNEGSHRLVSGKSGKKVSFKTT